MSIADEARAEAERQYPQIWRFGMNYAFLTERQSAFVAGAEWWASRPITDEQVGAVAVYFGCDLSDARAALEAARGVVA